MDKIKKGMERICPKCKEQVKFDATVCKHCQADLTNAFEDEKEQLAILILIGKTPLEIAKALGVEQQALKNFLNLHFGEPAVFKVKAKLEKDGMYRDHPDVVAGIEAVKKKKKSNRTIALGIAAVVALLLVYSGIRNYFDKREAAEQARQVQEMENAAAAARQDSIKRHNDWFAALSPSQKDSVLTMEKRAQAEPIMARIAPELESLKRYIREDLNVQAEDAGVLVNAALLGAWQKLYFEFNEEKGLTAELDRVINDYMSLLPRVLKRQYPVVRKAAVENWRKKLWENNVEVKSYDQSTSRVRFIAAMFANNSNVKEFHTGVAETLRQLRFKRAEYLWFAHDDEYTYYKITSPSDSEIIE